MLAPCTKTEVKGLFGLCGLDVMTCVDLKLKYTNVKFLAVTVDDQKVEFLLILAIWDG